MPPPPQPVLRPPSFRDVLAARREIGRRLPRTPLHRYPALDALLGVDAYVKHENYQPIGAFKLRGGLNLVSRLSPEERRHGIIAASTGNHGQSLAYAAREFGLPARVVVPEGANPGKVAAIRGMGAEVIFHGRHFDEARLHCEALARAHGYRYVHAGDEPLLLAGVGTLALELFEDAPDLDAVLVPVGGGSGAAGLCVVAQAIAPTCRVIGVQSEASPAAYESWRARRLVERPNHTFADGLATATAFALPQAVLWERLDDFVLVSDAEIRQAMVWMIEHAHTLAEPAGAAPLAAAYRRRADLAGQKVALVCSGGNASLAQLREALAASP